ncbi:MAG: GNAT family N-acetyltransferase [Lachnospiraceae bacterium]|nr:GNAT family N-acetyltransferase [Lachnospiraceae bacterium]
MEVRLLNEQEIKHAAELSRFVFDNCLRPRMEFPQTVAFVEGYLAESNLRAMKAEGKLFLWGAFVNEKLIGVGGMQNDGLITMLYVIPQYFKRKYGTTLLETMRLYAKEDLGLLQVSVNATPAWTSYYFSKQGFRKVNASSNLQVPFVSMYTLSERLQFFRKKYVSWKVIIAAIVACVLFATILGCGFMMWYLF